MCCAEAPRIVWKNAGNQAPIERLGLAKVVQLSLRRTTRALHAHRASKCFASSATARCGTKWITKAGLHFIRTKVNTITETDDLLKLSDFFFFEEVGSAVLPSGHS